MLRYPSKIIIFERRIIRSPMVVLLAGDAEAAPGPLQVELNLLSGHTSKQILYIFASVLVSKNS